MRASPSFVQAVVAGSNTQDAPRVNVGTSLSFDNPISGGNNSFMHMDVVVSRPFAMVDEITESSPAAEDGLQLGDQIVKFGNVEISDNLLQRLATEAQINLGRAVSLVVMRQGALINLTVTPRRWSGHGLLGCHFRIL
ncbi:26S proteasome non-ATPase regulatory subunit 9 [Forsythia ovata]|uniref:26S proteasome non-ATPase regulatory subunit 9 n=1 Tax=Forsythia ovata TaxID=205694 RepID=A0ABD1SS00_9LAMI